MKEQLVRKTEALRNLETQYSRMMEMQDFGEEALMEYHPKYIQLGANYFVQKNQYEKGLKLVHQLHQWNIDKFVKGVREDDYEFYDKNPNIKEVLIMGSSNVGKSSLINALNMGAKVAHTAKVPGKT